MAINTTKIMLVVTKGNWGGAQKYVYELATVLPKDAFEAVVACGEGDILPEKLKRAGIRTVPIGNLGRDMAFLKDAAVLLSTISLFKRERPDIVHLNSSKIGGLGAVAARLAGIKKIVFTVHGFAFNENRPSFEKILIKFFSWLTLVFSTDVICISKAEYDLAKKWPLVGKKVRLIPNGISIPNFLEKSLALQTLASHVGRPVSSFENKTVVISIGELTKNKGYEYAIPAFKNLPDFAYVIVGTGEDRANLEKVILENELYEKVALAGFVADASTFLKAADIFLLASVKEGLPYVLLEAGAARLPAVATNVGGIPEIIEDGISGILIPPKSPEAVTGALIRFKSDETFRKLCASQLEQSVSLKYNKSDMIKNTIIVYNDIV